jgi:hypothetical protein
MKTGGDTNESGSDLKIIGKQPVLTGDQKLSAKKFGKYRFTSVA